MDGRLAMAGRLKKKSERWAVASALAGVLVGATEGRANLLSFGESLSSVAATSPDPADKPVNDLSTLGMYGEYAWFPTINMGVVGNFVAQFASNRQAMQLMGGGGGIAYSLIGGKPRRLEKPDFFLAMAPRIHVLAIGGFAARNYDLSGVVPAPKPTLSGARTYTPRQGQFFGPQATLALNYYLSFREQVTMAFLRVSYVKSMNPPTQFQFTILEFNLGMGFSL